MYKIEYCKMKKRLIVAVLVLLPMFAQAQKIDKDYYDQFTVKRVMYTKLEKLNWKYKNPRIGGKMQYRFILNDDYQYMVLHWTTNSFLEVVQNATVQFKLDNGHVITLKNEKHTPATQGGIGTSKKDIGLTINLLGDIPKFATAHVTAIRIYTTADMFYDFEIDWKDSQKIHKAYMLFSREAYVGGRR